MSAEVRSFSIIFYCLQNCYVAKFHKYNANGQSDSQLSNQPINQPVNPSIHQSINQSINQSIDQSIKKAAKPTLSRACPGKTKVSKNRVKSSKLEIKCMF